MWWLIYLWASTVTIFAVIRPFVRHLGKHSDAGDLTRAIFLSLVCITSLSLSIWHTLVDVQHEDAMAGSIIGSVVTWVNIAISCIENAEVHAFVGGFMRNYFVPAVKAIDQTIWTILLLPFKLLKRSKRIIDIIGRL